MQTILGNLLAHNSDVFLYSAPSLLLLALPLTVFSVSKTSLFIFSHPFSKLRCKTVHLLWFCRIMSEGTIESQRELINKPKSDFYFNCFALIRFRFSSATTSGMEANTDCEVCLSDFLSHWDPIHSYWHRSFSDFQQSKSVYWNYFQRFLKKWLNTHIVSDQIQTMLLRFVSYVQKRYASRVFFRNIIIAHAG